MNQVMSSELGFFHQNHRSSSYSSLSSCLTEHWGDLPLKVDDSEDMIIYNSLRDAVNSGWIGSNEPDPVRVTAKRSAASALNSDESRKKRKGLAGLEAGLNVFRVGHQTVGMPLGEHLLVN
ncbi:hypothetical protein JRO89_XS11G0122500 [Xanthoceras sorbifolium]|uniref:Uncharacterized protein n=1 Tax=Xanthoceras sorbifolium TaxID=99658 RepID=A0ABQ8HFD2_9ROSI|nr:hypothetical protein JRO89_XS11G0122500 [Xanthoceras sorbifolium]